LTREPVESDLFSLRFSLSIQIRATRLNPSFQSRALVEQKALRAVPFLSPFHDPSLQCRAGDAIHFAIGNHFKYRRERWLGQSDGAFVPRFHHEQMRGVKG